MGVYRIIGDEVVAEAEFRDRVAGLDTIPAPAGTESVLEDVVPYVPVGIAKPLTIQIRHVYTGKFPKKGGLFGGGAKDVAVVSGVKDYSVFAATTRALNFIHRAHSPHTAIKAPSAFTDGTPIIAYYPALTADSLTLSVELAVDDFPQELVGKLGDAFQSLAGIPLLLPHAGFLLGAGEVIKLVGGLGNGLFDGRPEFEITQPLNFDVPGSAVATADFRLLSQSDLLRFDYKYDDERGLVHKQTDQRYDGDEPYVVISLDGRERPNLAEFAPTAASAAVLKRFFNIGDDVRTPIDTLVEGIRLASDMRYRTKALDVAKAMEKMPADSDARAALQQQYQALVKNIANDLFKPA